MHAYIFVTYMYSIPDYNNKALSVLLQKFSQYIKLISRVNKTIV